MADADVGVRVVVARSAFAFAEEAGIDERHARQVAVGGVGEELVEREGDVGERVAPERGDRHV